MASEDEENKRKKIGLLKPSTTDSSDRRKEKKPLDIERRSDVDRRQNIVGRGKFDQYFNLYNMMFDSHRVNPEITGLINEIMPDSDWQAKLAQEVSLDRASQTRKNQGEFRQFLLKIGAIEVLESPKSQSQKAPKPS